MGKKIQFINSGTFGCIYYPDFNCNAGKIGKQLYLSKIQKESDALDNELAIMDTIQNNIPTYYLYFAPILKVCPVKLNKIPDSEYKKCEIFNKNQNDKYISAKVRYVGEHDIESYIYTLPHHLREKKVNHIYYYCLHELNRLNNEDIIHFDIKSPNIMYDSINHIPILIDFGISFEMKNYTDAFYTDEYYTYWCIDIYIISYILLNKMQNEIVFESKLTEIRKTFIHKLSKSLSTFIVDFEPKFNKMFDDYFNKFIDRKWETVLYDLKRPKTWDNYSLAITLLMFNIHFSSTQLLDICEEIVLSPPNLRPTCADTIKRLDALE
jgi:serine/threonine protein kinase